MAKPGWKFAAQKLVPEFFEADYHVNLTLLFVDLLPALKSAHFSRDDHALLQIFAFAEWCARHKEDEIWNAAGVSFYEHIFDLGIEPHDLVQWISPETFANVQGLVAYYVGEARAENIREAMRTRKRSRHADVKRLIDTRMTATG